MSAEQGPAPKVISLAERFHATAKPPQPPQTTENAQDPHRRQLPSLPGHDAYPTLGDTQLIQRVNRHITPIDEVVAAFRESRLPQNDAPTDNAPLTAAGRLLARIAGYPQGHLALESYRATLIQPEQDNDSPGHRQETRQTEEGPVEHAPETDGNVVSGDDLLMNLLRGNAADPSPQPLKHMFFGPEDSLVGALEHQGGYSPEGQVVGDDGIFGELAQRWRANGSYVPEGWVPPSLAGTATIPKPRLRGQGPLSISAAQAPEPQRGSLALVRSDDRRPVALGDKSRAGQEGPSDQARHFGTDQSERAGTPGDGSQWGSRRPPRESSNEPDDGTPPVINHVVHDGSSGRRGPEAVIGSLVDGGGKDVFKPLDTGGDDPVGTSHLRPADIGGVIPSGVPATRESTARQPEVVYQDLPKVDDETRPFAPVVYLLKRIADKQAALAAAEAAASSQDEQDPASLVEMSTDKAPSDEILPAAAAPDAPNQAEQTGEPPFVAEVVEQAVGAAEVLDPLTQPDHPRAQRQFSTTDARRRRARLIRGAAGAALMAALLAASRGKRG